MDVLQMAVRSLQARRLAAVGQYWALYIVCALPPQIVDPPGEGPGSRDPGEGGVWVPRPGPPPPLPEPLRPILERKANAVVPLLLVNG